MGKFFNELFDRRGCQRNGQQCDQMARLFFQYLAILRLTFYTIIFAKVDWNFGQLLKTLNPLLPKLFFILPRWRSSSNLVTVNFGRQIFSNHTIAKNFFYFETLDDVWLAVGLSVDRSASQINASKDVSFFGKEFRKFLLPPLRIWTLGILLISTLDQGFLIPAQDSHTLYMCIMPLKEACVLGSGCGSVGRVVAPDIRGPWIESRYW